jgi:3-oxoadipate enol-lactonase
VPVQRVRDIDMYYEVHGTGDPLVLIGGLGNDMSEWTWMVEWCARSHMVLAFDNRGAGRTDKPDVPYSIEMMATDTDQLMEALGVSNATVLGVSMGGRIALELTLEHPQRVANLILVSASAAAHPDAGLTRMDVLSVLAGLLFKGRYPQPRYAQSLQRQASRAFDCRSRLDEIRVPTTIMHGRRDKVFPLKEAEQMRRGISDSQLVTFRGGHGFFRSGERRWFLDTLDAAFVSGRTVAAS